MMKIALIHNYFLSEDKTEQKIMRPYPPLGLLSVSAFLESKNIKHEVFDGTFSDFNKLKVFLNTYKPDIIGFYVTFLSRSPVLKSIEYIKKILPDSKLVIGGPDVKYHIENYINNGVDYCIIGEGELSFYDLFDALEYKKELSKIDGLAYKNENGIQVNAPRSHIKNLDSLPIPNRKKIDYHAYLDLWKKYHRYSSITINTQRGCPYSCNWCSHAVYGDTYRRRSPKLLVLELKELIEVYNPDRFWFVDDVFNMSKKWLEDFNFELKKENLSIAYECIVRADKLDKESMTLLKDSGCELIWIGGESGSQKVLDLMNRRVEAKKVSEMIKLAKATGIQTGTFIMIGYPGEEEEDINETIKHLKESDPDIFTINKAYPIKGTKLYDDVEPLINKKANWKSTPDHKVDFKRSYSSYYYYFAYRKIHNEVWKHKHKSKQAFIPYLKCSLKSLLATIGMKLMSL